MDLYHYTSIAALAMILKTRTLSLSRLDLVDDLTEGRSDDLPVIGKYFFVSSWTDLSEESIPFWKMYTPDMHGVRIGLVENPFVYHYPIQDEKGARYEALRHSDLPAEGHKSAIPVYDRRFIEDSRLAYKYMVTKQPDKVLCQVRYVEALDELRGNYFVAPVADEGDSGAYFKYLAYNDSKIGRMKLRSWEFQSEWRYLLSVNLNSSLFFGHEVDGVFCRYFEEDMAVFPNLHEIAAQRMRHARDGSVRRISRVDVVKEIYLQESPPFDALFIDISDDAVQGMEVTLGPKCDEADRTIVETLVDAYAPGADIRASSLSGLIR